MKRMTLKNGIPLLALSAAVCLAASLAVLAAPAIQKTFPTPEAAWKSLVDAVTAKDSPAVKAIFGPDCDAVISSGDAVADENALETFLAAIQEKVKMEKEGSDRVIVVLGNEDWPFPIPIVKKGGAWSFDTAEGKEELVNRRIGKNELFTVNFCREYVDMQEEFAKLHKEPHYAQKFFSDEGTRNGLYWAAKEGEPESPLGPLAVEAYQEGYTKPETGKPNPFHGYYFKILKAQGKNAPGGEKSYIKGERMTEGFALVAYPANYGASGIMTFIVNRQGIVFEKDLGAKTEEIAGTMKEYDPDTTWEPVKD